MSLPTTGMVFAANLPGTGQPNVSCDNGTSPSPQAAGAPGSAFNEAPGGAGDVYAGEQKQNTDKGFNHDAFHSISQYDVACLQQPPQKQMP
jgi:hypothetical protein